MSRNQIGGDYKLITTVPELVNDTGLVVTPPPGGRIDRGAAHCGRRHQPRRAPAGGREARVEELSRSCSGRAHSATVMQQALLAASVPVVPGADIKLPSTRSPRGYLRPAAATGSTRWPRGRAAFRLATSWAIWVRPQLKRHENEPRLAVL